MNTAHNTGSYAIRVQWYAKPSGKDTHLVIRRSHAIP